MRTFFCGAISVFPGAFFGMGFLGFGGWQSLAIVASVCWASWFAYACGRSDV